MTTSRTDGTDVTQEPAGLDAARTTSALPRREQSIASAMFAVLLLSYIVNAMDRQLYPVIAPAIGEEFGSTLPQLGLQSTILTLGMGVVGIPTGVLLARASRKLVALTGLAIFSWRRS